MAVTGTDLADHIASGVVIEYGLCFLDQLRWNLTSQQFILIFIDGKNAASLAARKQLVQGLRLVD
jgi:hypothetical protein